MKTFVDDVQSHMEKALEPRIHLKHESYPSYDRGRTANTEGHIGHVNTDERTEATVSRGLSIGGRG
jgi:hypothetical protein